MSAEGVPGIGATTGTPVGLLIILFDLGVFGVQYANDASMYVHSLDSDVRLRRACEVPRERFIPFCHDCVFTSALTTK